MYPRISDIINALTGLHVWLPFQTYGFFLGLAVVTSVLVTGRRLDALHDAGVIRLRRAPDTASRKEKRAAAGRKKKERQAAVASATPRPSEIMPAVLVIALVCGVVGSRLFYILESPTGFGSHPWRTIAAGSGLSFYGGFLLAAPAVLGYVRRRGIPIARFLDAAAPTVLLAYGIARIGCQLSGDGDWGIPADMTLKPVWLPTSLWAQTYPGNVEGVAIPPPGVYPTPIYETIACWALSAILFATGSRGAPGRLFALMVVFMGFERVAIERIRVNPRFEWLGLHPTQAEVISVLLIVAGAVGLLLRRTGDAAE
jgi:phosphatidylglycerol---prolipoprotein diacylglyceryl transferase